MIFRVDDAEVHIRKHRPLPVFLDKKKSGDTAGPVEPVIPVKSAGSTGSPGPVAPLLWPSCSC